MHASWGQARTVVISCLTLVCLGQACTAAAMHLYIMFLDGLGNSQLNPVVALAAFGSGTDSRMSREDSCRAA